jgi:probable HAF family extracellular repeat protein
MSVTGVSGDGSTLLVQDKTSARTETYLYKIATGAFTSLGFLGSATQQTSASAISNDGSVVAGYSTLDNGNIDGFTWNATNGMRDLGIPAAHPNTVYLEPTCISDDGTTFFGRLTELNGWVGFRYNTTTGFQDLGDLSPSACSADGMETVGIKNLYFPAIWSVGNGTGYIDDLLTANGTPQAFGTLTGPVTISPDATAITGSGPDAYLTDQIWYGVWQTTLPAPLKTAPIPPKLLTFSTAYQTTLTEPAGTLTQYAEFNNGASATLVKGPHYASSFILHADGSFVYTPKAGYISQGTDPEDGTPVDTFTYHLTSPNGTSNTAQVQISVAAPAAPTVSTPTYTNVTTITATLGGNVETDGGVTLTAVGVVYAPITINSSPQLGGAGVTSATGATSTGIFTVNINGLAPNTTYAYAAYATNSMGTSYSATDYFTTPADLSSWQTNWFGDTTDPAAAPGSDPFHTGVPNIEVFAFLGPSQDPSAATVSQIPQVQMTAGALYCSFTEPAGVSGVTYGAEVSADLTATNWQSVPDSGSGTEHIFIAPIGNNTQLFMRLRVTCQ